MIAMSKVSLVALALVLYTGCLYAAPEQKQQFPLRIQATADNINLRADSTVGSAVIVTIARGVFLDAVSESYEWYKVRLPLGAPAFVKKELTAPVNDNAIRVAKDKINVRMGPGENYPIIGKALRDEVITVKGEQSGWLRIEPLQNSYGWVNKKFMSVVPAKEQVPLANAVPSVTGTEAPLVLSQKVELEGTIEPYGKIFKRPATHKLLDSKTGSIYLLKGNTRALRSLAYHKVRITGEILPVKAQYPVVDVSSIISLDNLNPVKSPG